MNLKIAIIIVLIILVLYKLYPDIFINLSNSVKNWLFYNDDNNLENLESVNQNIDESETNLLNQVTNDLQKSQQHIDKVVPNEDDINIPFRYKNATYGDNYFINDGSDGTLGLTTSLCSKSCCHAQYPIPFELPEDDLIKNSGVKYVSSSYTCNNGFQDTGCLCMTKEQSDFLRTRGKNTSFRNVNINN